MCFEANQVAIRVNLDPLKSKTPFAYLIWIITYNNSDWEVLYRNLQKSLSRWVLEMIKMRYLILKWVCLPIGHVHMLSR